MAYNDPQTLTIDAAPVTLPRVITGTTLGKFVSSDANRELTIDPRGTGKRRRNVSRFYTKRTVLSPLGSGLSTVEQSMVSFTIDRPLSGVTDADILKDVKAKIAWLTANSDEALKKLIAGEN